MSKAFTIAELRMVRASLSHSLDNLKRQETSLVTTASINKVTQLIKTIDYIIEGK